MTYLDKFRREHPLMRKSDILEDYCPEDRLIVSASEDDPDGHAGMCPVDDRGETMSCMECWLRPVLPKATPNSPARTPQEENTAPRAPENAGNKKTGGGLTEEGPDRT